MAATGHQLFRLVDPLHPAAVGDLALSIRVLERHSNQANALLLIAYTLLSSLIGLFWMWPLTSLTGVLFLLLPLMFIAAWINYYVCSYIEGMV